MSILEITHGYGYRRLDALNLAWLVARVDHLDYRWNEWCIGTGCPIFLIAEGQISQESASLAAESSGKSACCEGGAPVQASTHTQIISPLTPRPATCVEGRTT